MDAELNRISHIWTLIKVMDRLCGKNAIRIYDLQVVISQKYCS